MVSIVLVSYNHGEITRSCIESIVHNVSVPFEIIVVDNCSNKATVDMLAEIHGVTLIRNKKNVGFPAGCNIGVAAAQGDVIWLLNNDTLVPPGSLERMLSLLLSDSSIGIVGPVTNNTSGIQQIPVEYTSEDEMWDFAHKVAVQNKLQTKRVLRLVGFSLLMRKSTFLEIGGLEETMGLGTFEDDILSARAVSMGYHLLVAMDSFIYHIGNASFEERGGYLDIAEKNQYLASLNVGMTLPDDFVLNEELMPHICESANRILCVECGAGAIGLYLHEKGVYAEALVSNETDLKICAHNFDSITQFSYNTSINLSTDAFDEIIIDKQISHRSALETIRQLVKCLDGTLVVHVPRIVNRVENTYKTYRETWENREHHIVTGIFDVDIFLCEAYGMGLRLSHKEYAQRWNGIFERNSFARYRQSDFANESDLPFPYYATFVFSKG